MKWKDDVLLGVIGAVCVIILAAILVPNLIRQRAPSNGMACKSNLKNIGTAMEMYSTDYEGKYPRNLSLITPNYLKTIPECPRQGHGSLGYFVQFGVGVPYNTAGFEDYYFLQCEGSNHTSVSVPANYPQYDGIQGLIDR